MQEMKITFKVEAEEAIADIEKLNESVDRLYQNLKNVKDICGALFTEK